MNDYTQKRSSSDIAACIVVFAIEITSDLFKTLSYPTTLYLVCTDQSSSCITVFRRIMVTFAYSHRTVAQPCRVTLLLFPVVAFMLSSHLRDEHRKQQLTKRHSHKPLDDGYPPLSLPVNHPEASLLQNIRHSTKLRPRWPSTPYLSIYELRSFGPASSSIVIIHSLKLIYIPVFKCATTTLMHLISHLSPNPLVMLHFNTPFLQTALHDMAYWPNYTIYNQPNELVQRYMDDAEYMKFAFVRNPYTRLLSAYNDKILDAPRFDYEQQMHTLYRHNETLLNHHLLHPPTFPQFIKAVYDILTQPRTKTSDVAKEGAYEDNTSRRDVHWRPQWELLHSDLIHVDFVGRFETLDDDLNVVLGWVYRFTDRRWGGGKLNRARTNRRRNMVWDRDMRSMVETMYQRDFQLLGYSLDPSQ